VIDPRAPTRRLIATHPAAAEILTDWYGLVLDGNALRLPLQRLCDAHGISLSNLMADLEPPQALAADAPIVEDWRDDDSAEVATDWAEDEPVEETPEAPPTPED
jgi:hypothetical protein